MPQPSRMTGPERREHLLAVATEEFIARGYDRTSTQAICEAARVTKPVLYQRFESKEDLYLAVLSRIDEETVFVAPPRDQYVDPRARASEVLRRLHTMLRPEFGLRLMFSGVTVNDEVDAMVAVTRARLCEQAAACLDVTDSISPAKREVLGKCLLALALHQQHDSEVQIDELFNLLGGLISEGLRAFTS